MPPSMCREPSWSWIYRCLAALDGCLARDDLPAELRADAQRELDALDALSMAIEVCDAAGWRPHQVEVVRGALDALEAAPGDEGGDALKAVVAALRPLTGSATPLLGHVDAAAAQSSRVVRVRGFLSPSEVAEVVDVAGRLRQELGRDRKGDSYWETFYLSTEGLFEKHLPGLRDKMHRLVRDTDREHWGVLPEGGGEAGEGAAWAVRCCEFHEMAAGGSLADPRHRDNASLITVDIMLSADPQGGTFEGGELQTLEPDNQLKVHEFRMGDALVFLSHKYHCVSPVTRGTRHVLVAEFWAGEERACGHRCDVHWGECGWAAAVAEGVGGRGGKRARVGPAT